MKYQETIVLFAVGLLVVLVAYLLLFSSTPTTPSGGVDAKEAKLLLEKGLLFGSGASGSDYLYAYTETSDGYVTHYVLLKKGNDSEVQIQNPLSTKRVYLLGNDTILCISYNGPEVCSSVQGNADLENYVRSLRAKFFDDAVISRNKNDVYYLMNNKFLFLSPEVIPKTVNGTACSDISYSLDFSNISVTEAAKFGIGATSPKAFTRTMCVNNETGKVLSKSLTYEFQGANHTYQFVLDTFRPASAAEVISAPTNLVPDLAVSALIREKEQQIRLANCYTTKAGAELDDCIADLALDLHRKDLCAISGARSDRCLVSLVPLTKDEGICRMIASSSYVDDCFIELAGAYKNSSYCSNLQNASKVQFCNEVSAPKNTTNTSNSSRPTNPTDDQLLNIVDKDIWGGGNATGNTSGNGTETGVGTGTTNSSTTESTQSSEAPPGIPGGPTAQDQNDTGVGAD